MKRYNGKHERGNMPKREKQPEYYGFLPSDEDVVMVKRPSHSEEEVNAIIKEVKSWPD